jgi:hypothetical protein
VPGRSPGTVSEVEAPDHITEPRPPGAAIDRYWLPLGAGGHSVRWNGRVYEVVVSREQQR